MVQYDIRKGWKKPKNFWSESKEGAWTHLTKTDPLYFKYIIYVLGAFLLLATFGDVDPSLTDAALLYISFLILYLIPYFANTIDPKLAGEALGWGNLNKQKDYFKIAVFGLAIWVAIYYVIGSDVEGQTIIKGVFQASFIKLQSIEPIRLISLAGIGIFAVSIAETLTLAGFILPSFTRYLGIYPAIISTSIFRALIHFRIFGAESTDVLMAIVFGFIFYPYVLREKSVAPAIYAHFMANTLAYFPFILAIIGI